MKEITAYHAKTKLAEVLREVETGEHFVITRHGAPVAELSPVRRQRRSFDEVVAEMDALRVDCRLDGLTIQQLRDEGRRG